jgi:hypothetical protein
MYVTISANEVDALNMDRYYAKTALQKKFFPESDVSEQKT